MMRQLRDIMDIKWYDKITNNKTPSHAHTPTMDDGYPYRWQRMENDRLPGQLLYYQLCEGKRNQGRPRLRFKDVVKRNMRYRQINLKSWQTMAGNRAAWRSVIKPEPCDSLKSCRLTARERLTAITF